MLLTQMYVECGRTYVARYHIARCVDRVAVSAGGEPQTASSLELVGTYIIPGTAFIAVSSYRDPRVTEFKVMCNKYAYRHHKNKEKS